MIRIESGMKYKHPGNVAHKFNDKVDFMHIVVNKFGMMVTELSLDMHNKVTATFSNGHREYIMRS